MAFALPVIPASEWNDLLDRLERKLSFQVRGVDSPSGWRHPWNLDARFNPFTWDWEVNVFPSYVNAMETLVPSMPWERLPKPTKARLVEGEGEEARAWLSEEPWFPVSVEQMRRMGEDADPVLDPAPVPLFFQALGVGGPPRLDIEVEGGGIGVVLPTLADPEDRRLLRAVDVILSVPKPRVKLASVEVDGAETVSAVIGFPDRGELPSVFLARNWRELPEGPSLLEQLAAGRIDDGFVEWSVGTVYLVSPLGAVPGADPDQSWIPFVANDLFWPRVLSYESTLRDVPALNLSLVTGLAGGIADPVFDSLLDPINEEDREAALILSQASVRVESWSM